MKRERMTDPLKDRIEEHLKIKGLGHIILTCADMAMRLYLHREFKYKDVAQLAIADSDYQLLKKDMKKKGHIDSTVYKAIELGELLMCLETKKKCNFAKECWITRKGFAECAKKYNGRGK